MEVRLQPDAVLESEKSNRLALAPRDISHYAFGKWPDHGVPNTNDLLDFLLFVKVRRSQISGAAVRGSTKGIAQRLINPIVWVFVLDSVETP